MAANPIPVNLSDLCVAILASIPEIQHIYVNEEPGVAAVLVVVSKKDFSVERKIYDGQLQIMNSCPGIRFSLRVISLRDRQLSDVVIPKGQLVFESDGTAQYRRAS